MIKNNLFNGWNLIGTIATIPNFRKYESYTENGIVEVMEADFVLDTEMDDAGILPIPIKCNTDAAKVMWNCFKKGDRVLVQAKIDNAYNTFDSHNNQITIIEIVATDITYPAYYGL